MKQVITSMIHYTLYSNIGDVTELDKTITEGIIFFFFKGFIKRNFSLFFSNYCKYWFLLISY